MTTRSRFLESHFVLNCKVIVSYIKQKDHFAYLIRNGLYVYAVVAIYSLHAVSIRVSLQLFSLRRHHRLQCWLGLAYDVIR